MSVNKMLNNSVLTQYLKEAAQIAANLKSDLKDSCLRKYQAGLFSVFISQLRFQKNYMDTEFMFAALSGSIQEELKNDIDLSTQESIDSIYQIKTFCKTLQKVYEDCYQSKSFKLLADETKLGNAYLSFYNDCLS